MGKVEEDLRGVEGRSNYDQETKKTPKLFIAVVGANTCGAQVDQSAATGLGKKSRLIKMILGRISFYGRGSL